jgi:hypothetical protein
MFYEIAIALAAALFFSFLLTPSLGDLPLVVIAGMMSAAAILAVRNVPIAVIAIAAPLARHLPAALSQRWPFLNDTRPGRLQSHSSQAIFAILAILLLVRGDFFSTRLEAGSPYPVGATEFIKQHGLHGNVLTYFSWGEYLIWHLAPHSKVFIDGRYDTVYPQRVLMEFFAFNYGQPGAAIVLEKYPTDYVLIPPDLASRKMMDASRDWRLLYRDETALLYARTGSAAAKVTGLPVIGAAKDATFP